MSRPLRTRIGSSLKTLTRRVDLLDSFLLERQSTPDPLSPLDDDALLIDISYLSDARLDVIHLFRKIEIALDQWKSLGTADPIEKEAHATFIEKNASYLTTISETHLVLSHADEVLTILVQEATTRGLEIPSSSDDLSSTSSIHFAPSTHSQSDAPAPVASLASRQEALAGSVPVAVSASTPNANAPVAVAANVSDAVEAPSAFGVRATTSSPSFHTSRSSMTHRYDSSHPAHYSSLHAPPFRYHHSLPPISAPINPPPTPTPHQTPSLFLQSALIGRAQLPSFDGDVVDWPPFHAAFTALLGDATLPGCQKLALLKSCLSGEPLQLISGLSQIDQDYDIAMHMLQEEFDNPSLIRHTLMARLQSIAPCDSRGTQIRSTYMEITAIIHQLCPSGEPDCPDLLVNLIVTKLPRFLQLRFVKESKRKSIGVFAVLDMMRDAVDDERIERLLKVTSPYRMNHSPCFTTPPPPPPVPYQPDYSSDRSTSCALCDGDHLTKHCSSFTTPNEKKKAAIERGLCLNCLSASHQVDTCPVSINCRKCRQRHHTTICTDRSSAPRQMNQESSPPPPPRHSHHRSHTPRTPRPSQSNQPARDVCNFVYSDDSHGNENAADDAHANNIAQDTTLRVDSSPLSHEKKPLLLCLDINVSSPDQPEKQTPVTLVFDTGSDVSYISKDLAIDLSLPTIDERIRSVTVFGIEEPQSELTAIHPLILSLPNGHQEKIQLKSRRVVCPPLDWAEKKDNVIIPRRSRPKILLGLDLLRRFFFTPSLRVESFPDHLVIHTILGACVSIENEVISNSIVALTSQLPPDKGSILHNNSPISPHKMVIPPIPTDSSESLSPPTFTPHSIGDIVLVENESIDPLNWTLGRIIQLADSSSALVRLITDPSRDLVTRPLTMIHRVNLSPELITALADPPSLEDSIHLDPPSSISSSARSLTDVPSSDASLATKQDASTGSALSAFDLSPISDIDGRSPTDCSFPSLLPPNSQPRLGDAAVLATLENSRREHWRLPSLTQSKNDSIHFPSPSTNLITRLDDSPAPADRAALTHPSAATKDRDNPRFVSFAPTSSTSTAPSRRAGG